MSAAVVVIVHLDAFLADLFVDGDVFGLDVGWLILVLVGVAIVLVVAALRRRRRGGIVAVGRRRTR